MSGQPKEETTRYYASERLREGREKIVRLARLMVILRAKIEKYRKIDVSAARDTYAELQKEREELVHELADIRLCLMETEEYRLASAAGQLSTGLVGFDLMSNAYKPVYDAFFSFAESLPVGGTKASAAVIGRLMNNVKMGYYSN